MIVLIVPAVHKPSIARYDVDGVITIMKIRYGGFKAGVTCIYGIIPGYLILL